MMIKVEGKVEALKDLEKAKKLIEEAEKILYRVPMKFSLDLTPDTGTETIIDSANCLGEQESGGIAPAQKEKEVELTGIKKYPQDKYRALLERNDIVKEVVDDFFNKYEMSALDFLTIMEEAKKEGLRRYRL